jgi:CHAT domain-containing protein
MKLHDSIAIISRITIGKFYFCTLSALLCMPLLSVHGAAQPASQPVKSPKELLAEGQEKLRLAELAHPGNSLEVAEALDDLVDRQLAAEGSSPELLELVKRDVAVAEAAAGSQSKVFVNALAHSSDVLVMSGRPAEARPFAERAFETAQREFPDSPEFANAGQVLCFACQQLGDFSCALRAGEAAVAVERRAGAGHEWDLINTLSRISGVKYRMGDKAGGESTMEESLSIGRQIGPDDPHLGALENNAGAILALAQEFTKAIPHLNNALEIAIKNYGAGAWQANTIRENLGSLYTRTGEFPLAWKSYETVLGDNSYAADSLADTHAAFARSLASGGDLTRAIKEGLQSAQMSRESFVLQARTLPERQALAYNNQRPKGLDIALSVLARHAELPATDIYQEVVRSRALVADEMARRQRNLNSNNDPEVARLLKEMDKARADLLAAEQAGPSAKGNSEAILQATGNMETTERELAERSVDQRNDQRISAVRLDDLLRSLPAKSVLVSYVAYKHHAVEKVDPARTRTPAYLAFVLKPNSESIHVFDLGDAKPIDELVSRARASADAEAHAGGLGSVRNEREWREASEALRKLVWDPLRAEVGDVKLALVVPDGVLSLIPFSGLPDGKGYLVEHGPVIHVLSSERDLVPSESTHSKTGLVAFGNPAFGQTGDHPLVSDLRDAGISCKNLDTVESRPLPGTAAEVDDIRAAWQRWNGKEASTLETGVDATRARFLDEAPRSRVLHVATHAFLLNSSCGDGNPLLRSGLVFSGGNDTKRPSILTAQQIASMDLNGMSWAVLSACNTGNGVLQDGEGVLGLERAFRVAGARSVLMSLWPVDDNLTRQFMHELYVQRLSLHASTAGAVWNAERKILHARRAAGKSTHPWYWAGFVGAGGWD